MSDIVVQETHPRAGKRGHEKTSCSPTAMMRVDLGIELEGLKCCHPTALAGDQKKNKQQKKNHTIHIPGYLSDNMFVSAPNTEAHLCP